MQAYLAKYLLMEQARQLVETITKGIQEKKGQGIVVADLSGIDGTICHYFVICQGNSPSQVEAITESVSDFARKDLGEKPDVREYYDLEHLWDDAQLTHIPDLD